MARTGGSFIRVPDAGILSAIRDLAGQAGLFAEPSGATGLAGIGPALDAGLIAADVENWVLKQGRHLRHQ